MIATPEVRPASSTGTGTGKWEVRILGDDTPLSTGLSEREAREEAIRLMDELSKGADEWDCYDTRDLHRWTLFRMG